MEKSKIERKPCSICGVVHTEDDLFEFAGKQLCLNCLERETVLCSHCGERIWSVDTYSNLCVFSE